MKNRYISIVTIVTILALLAGVWFYKHIHARIADQPEVTASDTGDTNPVPEPAAGPAQESATSKGFPMTITDIMNNTITLKQKPQKVAVISGPLLEMFDSVGGKSICTVHPDELSSAPKDTAGLPNIGRAANPDMIGILELEPDLVIAEAGVQNEIVTTLQKSKIKVIALKSKGDANRSKSLGIMKAIAGLE